MNQKQVDRILAKTVRIATKTTRVAHDAATDDAVAAADKVDATAIAHEAAVADLAAADAGANAARIAYDVAFAAANIAAIATVKAITKAVTEEE